jgi:ethanolamine utilization protein EutJ
LSIEKQGLQFEYCDLYVREFEEVIKNPKKVHSTVYYTGIDLGTACVVMAVLDENYRPVAGTYQYADVVRDGMVVDYIGAIRIVKKMKEELEQQLGCKLIYAAGAIPPGTDALDGGAVKNVIQAAGFEVTNMLDEPSAANLLLKVEDGAVVDIGGGTTGIAILEKGKLVSVVDEATGGTHFSLVLAGANKIPFADADRYKREEKNHREIMPLVKPVIEKISSIIAKSLQGYNVDTLVLVGGSSCLTGIEDIIQKNTGIATYKPENPMFVTPLGIALSCTQEVMD